MPPDLTKIARDAATDVISQGWDVKRPDGYVQMDVNFTTSVILRHLKPVEEEMEKLRGVIATHDLCHDLHGKVGAREFADGCAAEQRKLYGCAPDADELAALRAENARLRKLVDPVQHAGNDMEPDEYPGNSPAAGGE